MLMELVGKLRFLNEYRELDTVKPGDQDKASGGVALGVSDESVVSIGSFLSKLFMFTGENGLV